EEACRPDRCTGCCPREREAGKGDLLQKERVLSFAAANAMDSAITDSHHPDLGAGNPFEQFVARFQLIGINGELSSLDVDGEKLAFVAGLELRADIVLVNGITTAGELFLAVTALCGGHKLLRLCYPFSLLRRRVPCGF